jgi:aminoglycoside phosphotransferase (APT) family kinase protein
MDVVRAHTSVPVPVTRWLVRDDRWLGAPFLVMHRVDGRAPADIPPYTMTGWLHDLPDGERAELQQNVVATLAELHTLRPDAVDLSFLDRPDLGADALDRQLEHQRRYYDWARDGVRYPLVERAFAWLHDHRPAACGPAVLNWGDARIGNILFDVTRPVAVLDWEMAELGPAEVDVAWVVWMHRFFQDLAVRHGSAGLPGFLDAAEVATQYERASGTAVRDLHWYLVFAALRHAIITVRTTLRTVRFGLAELPDDVDDVVNFRGLVEELLAARG